VIRPVKRRTGTGQDHLRPVLSAVFRWDRLIRPVKRRTGQDHLRPGLVRSIQVGQAGQAG
jgi:hypothetical protein